jgi:hypothetical protein
VPFQPRLALVFSFSFLFYCDWLRRAQLAPDSSVSVNQNKAKPKLKAKAEQALGSVLFKVKLNFKICTVASFLPTEINFIPL